MGDTGKPRKSLGCAVILLLFGTSLLAGGAWLMQGWNESGAVGRSGAIILLVAGSLVMLPLVIAVVALAVIRVVAGRLRKTVDEMQEGLAGPAGEILTVNKDMYSAVHEFRPATETDFEGLDRQYYEQMTCELTARGFRQLGDLVDTTVEQKLRIHAPIRVFTAEGATTQVAVFHLVPAQETAISAGKSLTMREAITELSDGSFLLTSNTLGMDVTTQPPKIRKEQCELAISLADLLDRHELRKAELLRNLTGLTCVVIDTLEKAVESEKRQQMVKNEFRQQIGFADPEEIRRIGQAGESSQDRQAAAEDLATMVERERRKGQ